MRHLLTFLTVFLFSSYVSMAQKMYVTIRNKTQCVTLADNLAAQELVSRLEQAPISVTLNSSGGFEVWGPLGFSLTTNNEQQNAQPGDVFLYNGSNICFFYGTNSWSYTPIGKIKGLTVNELKEFLKAGDNNINVTLSIDEPTGVGLFYADEIPTNAYNVNGTLAKKGQKGITIQNGKKFIR